MTSFTTAMLTRTTEDPCIGTSAPYISQNGNTITLTPQNCEHSVVLVRATPASTMIPREFLYTAPFDITEDTYISAYNLRAGYKLGDDASGKLFEYHENYSEEYFYVEDLSGSDNTMSIVKNDASARTVTIYKSTDQTTWSLLGTTSTTALTATVPADGRLYLKATADGWGATGGVGIGNKISCSSIFKVGGNIMSLLYGDDFENHTTLDTTNSNYAFTSLFYQSTNLITAANLVLPSNATNYCYQYMFNGCTSLTTAPSLPATTLGTGCYEQMFYNCSSLVTPPASLPATTMPSSGYNAMFYGCTSLTTAPELPATTLGSSCYRNMFGKCTSLATAPELPATTLATYCYEYMFDGCTSLTRAPELPATTLVTHCYFVMFRNCSRLNYIKAMFTTKPANTYTQNWVSGVASNGTFVRDVDITWNVTGTNGVPSSWTIIHSLPEATSTPFYIQNETSSNGSIGILKNGSSAPVFNVYISTDNYDWVKQGSTDSTVTITLPANSRVYVRSQTSTWALSGQYNYVRFNTNSTDYSVGGNIMSLLYGHENYDNYTTFSGTNTFRYLLAYNSHIISAANLQLPDTVTDSCYKYMFYASPNLRNAPELPATTLVSSCYEGMFYHCTNLNNIKAMFTTTPGSDYTLDWVDGVAATGTFTKNASATWNVTGTSGVPSGWTVQTASA